METREWIAFVLIFVSGVGFGYEFCLDSLIRKRAKQIKEWENKYAVKR